MSWGTIMAGRLPLREDWAVEEKGNELTVKGQESSPPLSVDQLERRREDFLGMDGRLIPVTFTDKARLNGWYRVAGVKATTTNTFGAVLTLDWTLDLTRLGTEAEVDLESRLSGPLTRNTSHAASGERWHSPPAGHYGYWSSTTIPTVVTRTGEDGAHLVYRGVPATHPRWGCAPAGALLGRCRFLDDDAFERTGANFTVAATGWELSNGLVRVRPLTSGGVLEVASYTGAWRAKSWDLLLNAVSLGVPRSVTLVQNELELVIVRVLWASAAAPGRTTADLILRRGARFLELYLRTSTASAFKVVRATTEAGTAGTGYIRATADDADGNRYIVGSAQAFTNDTVTGGLSKTATTTLDAFIGVAAGGAAAVSGDQPDHLMAQYLGSPNELVVPVRR